MSDMTNENIKQINTDIAMEAAPANDSPSPQRAENTPDAPPSAPADPESDLWPAEVDGSALLDELTERIGLHSILLPGRAEAMALWVVHAHAHEAADHSPFLGLVSPEKRCGKTTNLIMLRELLPNPILTSNISSSALYRATHGQKCALMIDEADRLFKSAAFIGIIQSAHARLGGTVDRTDSSGKPVQFSVYGPKVYAMIGLPEDTIADRSLTIEMRRKRPDESCERLRSPALEALKDLKLKAARFVADNYMTLVDADPAIPQGLYDRAEQNWRPLLAIADLAGGDWPDRARRIAVEMASAKDDDLSPATLLLSDLRDMFVRGGVDRIVTYLLTDELVRMEERPWARWSDSLAPANLADMLRPFGIKPKRMRQSGRVMRGYERAMFEDVWVRYLPPLSQPEPVDEKDQFKEALQFIDRTNEEDDKIK